MYYAPGKIAEKYPDIVKAKAEKSFSALLCLSILGGAFIGLATFAAHIIATLLPDAGVAKLVSSLLFPTGLAMILIAGGELFTGNCMMPICLHGRHITVGKLLQNWAVVYFGNFIGALLVAWLSTLARADDAAFRAVAVAAATGKISISFGQVFVRGILCNIFVCAAVWMSYSTDSTPGKLAVTYFPVALFVLCGTEHCVANMYYFTAAFFAGGLETISIPQFLLGSLLPSTLGNIVGGSLLYGGLLWGGLFRKKA